MIHPGNHAPVQTSLAKSLLYIAAAAALDLFRWDPVVLTIVEAPFGASRSGQEHLQTQLERAKEAGRGRRAVLPIYIPWKGWKDIFWRTASQASEDRLLAIAAGVVFYGLLALFPAVTALVSCYGLFAKPDTINDHLSFLQGVMPAEAYSIVQDQIARVVAKGHAGLSFGFAIGLLLALWSANAGMKALMDALNIVNEEDENRGFVRLNFVWYDGNGHKVCTLASAYAWNAFGSLGSLPIWSEPACGQMGVDQLWRWICHTDVVRRLCGAVFLLRQFCQLQCNLWFAGRGNRNHDVDVDVRYRRPVRRGAEFRDRASDCSRYHGWERKAARCAGRHDG